jgi:hypothetical protein
MDQLVWMFIGAGGLAGMILMRLAARHGLAWVRAELKARASAAETAFKAKVAAAAGDLGARLAAVEAQVKATVDGDLARAKADIAALKAKLP